MYAISCFFFLFLLHYNNQLLTTADFKTTTIHLAIQYNSLDVAFAFLYLSEATINQQDLAGNTPLHYAVKKKSPALCHLLLQYKAKDTIKNNNEETPYKLLEKLLKSDPTNTLYHRIQNIFYAFSQKTTEEINNFCMLCFHGKETAIKELFYNIETADELETNEHPLTIWFEQNPYAEYTDLHTQQIFMNIPPPLNPTVIKKPNNFYHLLHTYDSFGETALINAIISQNRSIIALLLKTGADPNLPNQQGITPLIKATKQNDTATVALLLSEKHIALEEKSLKGYSALHYAVLNKNKKIIRLLLQAGANPQTIASNRMTPLHETASHASTSIAQILIEAGAPLNALGPHQNNPLHFATAQNNVALIQLLLKKGATYDVQNGQHETALIIAAREGHLESVEALLDAGVALHLVDKKKNSALHYAAMKKKINLLQYLLEIIQTNENKQSLLNIQNESGNTALHLATYYNNFKAIKRLIHGGIDVNIQNQHGDTALHQAIKNKKPFIITYLMHAGSDLTLKNEEGDAPLEYAQYQLHSLQILIAFGSLDSIRKLECLEKIETLKKIIVLLKEKISEPSNAFPELLITPILYESTVIFEPIILNEFNLKQIQNMKH